MGAAITTSEYAEPSAVIEGTWACRYLPGQLVKLTVWWVEVAVRVATEPFGYRVARMNPAETTFTVEAGLIPYIPSFQAHSRANVSLIASMSELGGEKVSKLPRTTAANECSLKPAVCPPSTARSTPP